MKRLAFSIFFIFCNASYASELVRQNALQPEDEIQERSVSPESTSPLLRAEFEQKRKEDERLHRRTLAKGRSFVDPEWVSHEISEAPDNVELPGARIYLNRPEGQETDEEGFYIDETVNHFSAVGSSVPTEESQEFESQDTLSRLLTQMSQKDKAVIAGIGKKHSHKKIYPKKKVNVSKPGLAACPSGLEREIDITHKVAISIELKRDDENQLQSNSFSWIDETVAACKAVYYLGVGSFLGVIAYQIVFYQSQRPEINT